jgi:hypothetical protein
MDHGIRASDDDRHRVVTQLEAHTAAGRLTLQEFSERVDRALAARTHGDLAEVTRDLPPPVPGPTSGGGRQLLVAFAVAALVLALLAVVFAIARH